MDKKSSKVGPDEALAILQELREIEAEIRDAVGNMHLNHCYCAQCLYEGARIRELLERRAELLKEKGE